MGRTPLVEGIVPINVSQPLLTLSADGDGVTFNQHQLPTRVTFGILGSGLCRSGTCSPGGPFGLLGNPVSLSYSCTDHHGMGWDHGRAWRLDAPATVVTTGHCTGHEEKGQAVLAYLSFHTCCAPASVPARWGHPA